MPEDDELLGSAALDLMVWARQDEDTREQQRAQMHGKARETADDARLGLAMLAGPALRVIAARLEGAPAEGGQGALKAGEFPLDEQGRPVTKEREDTAWEVLSRIGVPRLRATAVAASISAAPSLAAPGSPGWVAPELEEDDGPAELGEAQVDAKIEAYLQGAVDGAEAARKAS